MSASKQASKRLQKEYQSMQKGPPPFVWARPNEANILEWHYILRGPTETPYYNGEYYGVLTFPADYPFAPPGIKMVTPSGRFAPNAAICTSMSNFHPGSWNPAWSVQTILTGLLSFMLADEITTGSIRTTDAERKKLAAESHAWNLNHPKFKSIFPDYATPLPVDLPNMGPPTASASTSTSTSTDPISPTSTTSPTTSSTTTTTENQVRDPTLPPPPPPPPPPPHHHETDTNRTPDHRPNPLVPPIGVDVGARPPQVMPGRAGGGGGGKWREMTISRQIVWALIVLGLSWAVVRFFG